MSKILSPGYQVSAEYPEIPREQKKLSGTRCKTRGYRTRKIACYHLPVCQAVRPCPNPALYSVRVPSLSIPSRIPILCVDDANRQHMQKWTRSRVVLNGMLKRATNDPVLSSSLIARPTNLLLRSSVYGGPPSWRAGSCLRLRRLSERPIQVQNNPIDLHAPPSHSPKLHQVKSSQRIIRIPHPHHLIYAKH